MADASARSGAPPAFVPVYSAFAAAYLLSYLYRTVNAVISPELTRELDLAAGSLGFLTSAYFLAFGAMQIPVGMLLDRYGPRRVEPVLLAIAACGALLFGLAHGLPGLTLGLAGRNARRERTGTMKRCRDRNMGRFSLEARAP